MDTSVWDRNELLDRVGGDEEFLTEVVRTFLEDAPTRFDELRKAFSRGDEVAARLHSHALKGAAASIGAGAFRDMAKAIEDATAGGQLERAKDLMARLHEEFQRLKPLLVVQG